MKHFDLPQLYTHTRGHPIGETILDALIPILHEHPGWRGKTIAKRLGVKPSHLSGAVTILTGMSLDGLQSRWRMYKALELLRTTDLPLAEIACRCGYSQYKHLAKAMKRTLKVTPFEYRHGYRRTIDRPLRNIDRLC